MNVAVVGLGLIGGSLAKAFCRIDGSRVFVLDTDKEAVCRARLVGAMHKELTKENISECDYVFVALYPQATEAFMSEYAPFIKKDSVFNYIYV